MTVGVSIEARHLAASIRLPAGQSVAILKDVSFTVDEGSTAAIVGRSGSGKTTLLTLLGLMGRPDSGELFVGGHSVARISDSRAAGIRNELLGFVFQSFSLIESHSVLENIELPYAYGRNCARREIHARANHMLELVGLSGFARRKVAQLSGGEQQRVAIARALVRRPRIILADEPTGSLDVDTGHYVMRVLRDAAVAEGSCLVVVTHDPLIASTLDSIWLLAEGVLTQSSNHMANSSVINLSLGDSEPSGNLPRRAMRPDE